MQGILATGRADSTSAGVTTNTPLRMSLPPSMALCFGGDGRARRLAKYLLIRVGVSLALAIGCAGAQADVWCLETVTQVIMHSNGGVYFTTNATCPSWCQLNWSTADAISKGYAMLLSANAQGKQVNFDWPSLSNCTTQNATYASPGALDLYQ